MQRVQRMHFFSCSRKDDMKPLLLYLLSTLLAVGTLCRVSYADEATIRIRVTKFPPQYYQDASGAWTGLDVELGRALVQAAGLKPEFVELPWSRALSELKDGGLDMMMNVSITPEREEYINFIGPERVAYVVLVVKQGNENLPIKSLDDLAAVAEKEGKKFGILQDAVYSKAFMEKYKNPEFAKHIESVAEALLNLKKTEGGRILGFFEDKNSITYWIRHNPECKNLALHSYVVHEDVVYFGVSKKVPTELQEKLRQAYETLEKDGTFDKFRNATWD